MTAQQSDFVPAVSPLTSTTTHAPDSTIITSVASISSQGDDVPAYHTRSEQADGLLSAAIAVREIFGIHKYIHDVYHRLALEGHLTITPGLYFRGDDPNNFVDIPVLPNDPVAKVPDFQVLVDLDHVASRVSRNGGGAYQLMIAGFYWDGRITWLYTARNPRLKTVVARYGKLVGDKTLNSPKYPVDIATDLNTPISGLHGGQNTSIPQDTVETVRRTLCAVDVEAGVVTYPDAGYTFSADHRPSYHKESAKDGWQRMLEWFVRCGGKK